MDLQFPHHENEIAQSEGATGQTLARYWIHNGFLNVDNEKMSKSLGNFFTIRDVLQRYDGETLRFFMLRTHYRSPFNFSDAHLDDARSALRRLYGALAALPEVPPVSLNWQEGAALQFKQAMDDDFNTPQAVAVLFDLASQVYKEGSATAAGLLKALGGVLGVLQIAPQDYLRSGEGLSAEAIEQRIEQRLAARQSRNFALADQIRDELAAQGVELKDGPQGTTWVRR
jgi:cysteinyl-tRNA synthetase